MGRYDKYRILTNASEYYASLREGRNAKFIRHYETPTLNNPTVAQRRQVVTVKHIWKYGDRLYNLADQYYNDTRYWWVIAWYNGYGLEGDIRNGAIIHIPVNLESALRALGVS